MFKLWLEFEDYSPRVEKDDCFNIEVDCDGEQYAMTVWSYDYMREALSKHETHLMPPDLLVVEGTREDVATAIIDLIECDKLPEHCKISED